MTVGTLRYLEWVTHRATDRANHIWARRDVVERLGAQIERLSESGAVYIRHPGYRDLAGLLAALCAVVIREPLPPGDVGPA